MIVVDCTMIAHLVLSANNHAKVRALWLKDPIWCAPSFWEAEFASVLAKYERAKMLDPASASAAAREAIAIIGPNAHSVTIDRALATARRSLCSTYDSYYLALAEDLKVPLYTHDKEVLKKCPELAHSL